MMPRRLLRSLQEMAVCLDRYHRRSMVQCPLPDLDHIGGRKILRKYLQAFLKDILKCLLFCAGNPFIVPEIHLLCWKSIYCAGNPFIVPEIHLLCRKSIYYAGNLLLHRNIHDGYSPSKMLCQLAAHHI